MHRIHIFIIYMFFGVLHLQAMEQYIKFRVDCNFGDKGSIKCKKNEILQFINSEQEGKIDILFGRDTIKQVSITSKKFDTIQSPNKTYLLHAKELVLSKGNDMLWVDVNSVSPKDTVTLISENGLQVKQFIAKREAELNKVDYGTHFRLVITNSPSIFYSKDELVPWVNPNSDRDGDGVIDREDSCPDKKGTRENHGCPEEVKPGFFASLVWWHYMLLFSGLVFIGIAAWLVIKYKKNPPTLVGVYKPYLGGNSLSVFAQNNGISLEELIKLNSGTIDNNYESYGEKRRKEVQVRLIGQELLVGYEKEKNKKSDNMSIFGNIQSDPPKNIQENKNFIDGTESPTQFRPIVDDNIERLLQKLEGNLIREIQKVVSKNGDNSNELQRLNKEVDLAKKDKQKQDELISGLKDEKNSFVKQVALLTEEREKSWAELSLLKEKLISVEYLKGYTEEVSSYLKFCSEVSRHAYDCFNRLKNEDIQSALPTEHLIIKFQTDIIPLPLGNWVQILQDITDSGTTTNKQLIRSFSQLTTDNEKQREFRRLLFNQVLIKYSSSILILTEALKNLDRFQISTELVKDIQSDFAKYQSELLSRVKITGLEPKYVSLFKNYMDFLGQSKSVDDKLSVPYDNVIAIEKDFVAEIVSYGFKNVFNETDTLIILA